MNSIFKNWQTSAAGVIAGLTLLFGQLGNFLDDDPKTFIEKDQVIAAFGMIWLGLSARQSSVADYQVGAGNVPPDKL